MTNCALLDAMAMADEDVPDMDEHAPDVKDDDDDDDENPFDDDFLDDDDEDLLDDDDDF